MQRICIVGSMLRNHKDILENQGEILSKLLEKEGYSVSLTSPRLNRVLRAIDIAISLVLWRHKYDVVLFMA